MEHAVGYMGIPIGIVGPMMVDNRETAVPVATEEPSVVAAATYTSQLLNRHGGVETSSDEPVMATQIYLEKVRSTQSAIERLCASEQLFQQYLSPILESMNARGGGWRGMEVVALPDTNTIKVSLKIDVRNSLGANLLNSLAEYLKPLLEQITGGSALMAILSNRAQDRIAQARLCLPAVALSRPGYDGLETAKRIVRAAEMAMHDPDRAVTHNKGIMNGVSGLALVTGNDTRAIEAAAHAHASRNGKYSGLSEFRLEGKFLHGTLSMPLPFAVTGGSVDFHPTSRWALSLLGEPDAPGLSRIAAALGLLQNLAALRALVSEGIQKGHMECHAKRLSFKRGSKKHRLIPLCPSPSK